MAEEMDQVEAFHQADFVRLHDWAAGLSDEALPFYGRLAREHGSPVLDAACTTGRLDVALAREGAEVVGLVCSQAMLELARARVEAEPAEERRRISLFQDSVEEFELDRHFAVVAVPDSAVFALHGRFSLSQCFRRLYRHTAPGGVAIVDAVAPERMANQEIGRRVQVAEGLNPATGRMTRLTRRVNSIFWDTQMLVETQSFVETDGEREREFAFRRECRWLGREEGVELLNRAGYPEVSALGDYGGTPYNEGSPRLILVAHRLERDFI